MIYKKKAQFKWSFKFIPAKGNQAISKINHFAFKNLIDIIMLSDNILLEAPMDLFSLSKIRQCLKIKVYY